MAEPTNSTSPQVAKVDYLVDENGSRIDVPDGSGIKVAGEHEASVGATGPTNWWLYGLVALVAVVALVVVAVRFFRDDSSSPVGPRRSAARRALDDRYARGELTTEQYREQLADLGEQP